MFEIFVRYFHLEGTINKSDCKNCYDNYCCEYLIVCIFCLIFTVVTLIQINGCGCQASPALHNTLGQQGLTNCGANKWSALVQ